MESAIPTPCAPVRGYGAPADGESILFQTCRRRKGAGEKSLTSSAERPKCTGKSTITLFMLLGAAERPKHTGKSLNRRRKDSVPGRLCARRPARPYRHACAKKPSPCAALSAGTGRRTLSVCVGAGLRAAGFRAGRPAHFRKDRLPADVRIKTGGQHPQYQKSAPKGALFISVICRSYPASP